PLGATVKRHGAEAPTAHEHWRQGLRDVEAEREIDVEREERARVLPRPRHVGVDAEEVPRVWVAEKVGANRVAVAREERTPHHVDATRNARPRVEHAEHAGGLDPCVVSGDCDVEGHEAFPSARRRWIARMVSRYGPPPQRRHSRMERPLAVARRREAPVTV